MDTEIKEGTKVDDKLLLAAQLVSDLYNLYAVKTGEIQNDYLQVDQVMGKSVVFPLTGDRDLLIGSIRFILSRLKVESFDPRINLIDLRFKNPVLKYGQK
jgi:hypothetical protein